MNKSNPLDLPIINPHAAGVDVGSEKFFLSINGQEPRVFLTVTTQIQKMCQYCKERESGPWRWRPPECIGLICMGPWKKRVLKSS
jgi:hypothetical protein